MFSRETSFWPLLFEEGLTQMTVECHPCVDNALRVRATWIDLGNNMGGIAQDMASNRFTSVPIPASTVQESRDSKGAVFPADYRQEKSRLAIAGVPVRFGTSDRVEHQAR